MEKFGRYALVIIVLASIVVLEFVGPCTTVTPVQQPPQQQMKVFSASELSKYNGQNGQPAYVAADGLVYDVTGSPFWGGGNHSMCNIKSTAGRDLTSALNQAPPNMRTLLQKFPVVGRYQ